MTNAISISQLTKEYPRTVAVDHVDLEVFTGEVFGFLGPNGAGKSTAIRCLLDLSKPTSGSISIFGLDSREQSMEIRRRTGYLPGDLALYGNLTGRELLKYFANLRGGVEMAYVDELADRFDADLSRRCREYSSGNRQKVGLIQAFMHRPELIVMDEPSAGLDPLIQQAMQQLIREVAEEGRTVFLSSHTLSEVDRVADRVGIIRRGRLVEVAKVTDLKAKAVRKLEFEFAEPVAPGAFEGLEGVRDVTGEGRHVSLSFEGEIETILRHAMRYSLVNLQSREADLETIFLDYYRDENAEGGKAQETASAAR